MPLPTPRGGVNTAYPAAPTPADWARLQAAIHAQCRGTAFGPLACWPWKGPTQTKGYGAVNLVIAGQRQTLAHRLVLACVLGRLLAPTEQALHSCGNRRCCNPAHLRPGTARDNWLDAVAAGTSRLQPGRRADRAVAA